MLKIISGTAAKVGVFVAAALLSTAALSAGIKVTYPANETAGDTRFNDLLEIMRTALEKTTPEFGPFEMEASAEKMNEERTLNELKGGKVVNIAWSSTSTDKEKDLLPIRIPLRKGILGYRVALIQSDKQAEIDKVTTLAELKKLTIGQGTGWGDVALYEANGFKVTTAKYDELFKMTAGGRFDLFPRGISEAFAEQEHNVKANPKLAVEKNILIYYPWPYYFFFNKADGALQKRMQAGIRKMIKDGSFDSIFKKYNGKAIAQANLKGRKIFRIKNALLPKETPFEDPTLWFNPVSQ
ncbi:transporter substrate-binding domain-containing protein [Janthinobacterium sp.]|uniref:substrate-binding periplasmic protein n=1 Tax=Janthinobacterium sp. TaxID=1871054 RepID=UPI00293D3002|nr:transporter substrate-binding domain-containing protein [Janthinobacterium sp.]